MLVLPFTNCRLFVSCMFSIHGMHVGAYVFSKVSLRKLSSICSNSLDHSRRHAGSSKVGSIRSSCDMCRSSSKSLSSARAFITRTKDKTNFRLSTANFLKHRDQDEQLDGCAPIALTVNEQSSPLPTLWRRCWAKPGCCFTFFNGKMTNRRDFYSSITLLIFPD